MKKFWIQVGILMSVIFGSMYFTANPTLLNFLFQSNSLNPFSGVTQEKKLKINNTVLTVEVADTQSKRTQGLSGRSSIGTENGMLFVFPEEKKFQFWMKNMKFPLDFIFINNGQVVDIIKNVPVPSAEQADNTLPIYEPTVPVNMMLEVNAGFGESHNIQVGNIVTLLE